MRNGTKRTKKPTRAELYPPLYGQLNRERDSKTIQLLDECIKNSGRTHSQIVSECVRLALPLIVSGKAAVMKG